MQVERVGGVVTYLFFSHYVVVLLIVGIYRKASSSIGFVLLKNYLLTE